MLRSSMPARAAFSHCACFEPSRSATSGDGGTDRLERASIGKTRGIAAVAALAILALAQPHAQAQSTPTIDCSTNASIFNTAYDAATGGTLPVTNPATLDAHWEASADGTNWTPAIVSGQLAAPWATSPFGNADWISSDFVPPSNSPVYYRYVFNIAPSVPLGSFAIQFDFYVDDNVSNVRVNGAVALDFGLPGAGGYIPGAQTHMAITSGQWVNGTNEIVLQTWNVGPPSGLMAQTTVDTTCPSITKTAVPDPTAGPLVAGDIVTYTVTAANSGVSDASGTAIDDPLPPGLASGTWTCSSDGTAAVCPAASGTMPISDTIAVFPAASRLVYNVTAQVADDALPSAITNTAQLTPPLGQPCTDGSSPPCAASVTHGLTGLTIDKVVAWPAGASPLDLTGASFDFAVACTDAGGAALAPFDATVTLDTATTGNATVYGVPPGGRCDVNETVPLPVVPNYDWDAVPPGASVAISTGNASVVITNTLTRATSTLDLRKTVVGGPAAGITATFAFDADCGVDGTFSGTVDVLAAGAGSGVIAGVPAGATCTITEGAFPAAPANYTWGTPPPSVTVTTTQAGPNPAAFTNTLTRQASSLDIGKSVVGGPAAGVTATFAFDIDCGIDGSYTGNVVLIAANSGNGTVPNLPAGATCSVSEAALPAAPANYAWSAPPPAVTLVLTPSGPNRADFTNTLARQSGAISLSKAVSGGPAGGITATLAFSANCGPDGTFAGSVALINASQGVGAVADVPAGATCIVSEDALPPPPADYTWGAAPPAVTLTTTAAGPNTAAFTNVLSRQTSSIALTKTIAGGPAGGISATFVFDADCGADGTYSGAVLVSNATTGSGTIANVPAGATCTVSENSPPAAPANYAWGSLPPSVALTTTTAGPNGAAFTNTLSRNDAAIALTKTVSGGPAGGVSGSFAFAIDCGPDGVFSQTVTLTNASSASGSLTLPSGSSCAFAETATLPAAPAGYHWDVLPQPQRFAIAAGLAVNFTNTLVEDGGDGEVPRAVPSGRIEVFALLALLLGGLGARAYRKRSMSSR